MGCRSLQTVGGIRWHCHTLCIRFLWSKPMPSSDPSSHRCMQFLSEDSNCELVHSTCMRGNTIAAVASPAQCSTSPPEMLANPCAGGTPRQQRPQLVAWLVQPDTRTCSLAATDLACSRSAVTTSPAACTTTSMCVP